MGGSTVKKRKSFVHFSHKKKGRKERERNIDIEIEILRGRRGEEKRKSWWSISRFVGACVEPVNESRRAISRHRITLSTDCVYQVVDRTQVIFSFSLLLLSTLLLRGRWQRGGERACKPCRRRETDPKTVVVAVLVVDSDWEVSTGTKWSMGDGRPKMLSIIISKFIT